ncbi:MAG: GFA family protein [Thermodesulfobacteriota bacterium]
MKLPIRGGCACGRVRYEIRAEPTMSGICHCRECQRSSGGDSASNLLVPLEAVTVAGTTRCREYVADSGSRVEHHFCPECGSQVYGKSAGMPGLAIRAGSLDDASWFRPQLHVFTSSARPWTTIPTDVPAFAKMPPGAS